jgi:hypothetical protein
VYLRDLANFLNGVGSKTSYVEHLRLVPSIQNTWQRRVSDQKIKARMSGKFQSQFIEELWPGKFGSYRDYLLASSFWSAMDACALFDKYVDYANKHVVFSTPNMSNHVVYLSSAAVAKLLLHSDAPKGWHDAVSHSAKQTN